MRGFQSTIRREPVGVAGSVAPWNYPMMMAVPASAVLMAELFADILPPGKAGGGDYGLAASVWTRDHGVALRASAAIDSGCVWINCHIPLVAEMPHGGVEQSGYGKDLSAYSLEDHTRVKHVMSYVGDE